MRFLNPEFLFALVLIAVPVIVHLFNFRRFRRVYFSNVALLKKVNLQTTGARQVKRYALLLCRCLAIAFLVLAFARPYVVDSENELDLRNRLVTVYLDNSYSMEAQTREGTLLDAAKSRAKKIVSAYGVNDRFQLVTNDFEGLHQHLLTKEEFDDAVDTVGISPRSRTLRQVVERQSMLSGHRSKVAPTIYFLSDFQQNLQEGQPVVKDSGRCFLVRFRADDPANISIDSVWFMSPLHQPGSSEKVVVRLKNSSDKDAGSTGVRLSVEGQQKALSSVYIDARKVVLDTLTFTSEGRGWQEGDIEIIDHPFTFDDKFVFSYEVKESLPLLIIDDGNRNPYIEAVYGSEPFFKAEYVVSGAVNYGSLGAYPMIILPGSATLSEGLIHQLSSYVRAGGTLFLFPPQGRELSEFSSLTSALGVDRPLSSIDKATRVSRIETQHALFRDVFQSVSKNIDLPEASSYVRYSTHNHIRRNVILRFENRDPFLTHYNIGSGQVYLSAVAPAEENSNLVRHSLFVPIMYQSAFQSIRDQPLYYSIGTGQQISLRRSGASVRSVREGYRLRRETLEIIPDLLQTEVGTRLFISEQITKPGIYELVRGDSLISKVAFNINPSESDFTFLTEKKLRELFPSGTLDLDDSSADRLGAEIKGTNYGAQLWKLCLILSLICLAAEILLLR